MSSSRAALVIPCFNEARRLIPERFTRFLSAQRDVDLIFVNDGSVDDTTALLARIRLEHERRVTTLDLESNRGKGEAVRQGVLRALVGAWEYIGYWDADLSTPLEASTEWIALLDQRTDIDWLFGARVQLLGRSIRRRALRHYLGRVFATGASLTLGLPVYDTQCGAKLFRRTPNTAAVFARPFLSRWAFDVEVLARIMQEHAITDDGHVLPVCEVPLQEWHEVGGSTLGITQMARMAADLVRIAIWFRRERRVQMRRQR